MGGGTYSSSSKLERDVERGIATYSVAVESGLAGEDYVPKTRADVFKRTSVNNAMSPFGINVRESCDSDEHPESLAIIIALDVTGSMGTVPHYLVQEGLPHIMDKIIESGIKDPQVLFLGIGDHECDTSPLQVGQFESSDELLDKWLTDVYLEGGGGGNMGESYSLAWYFAANHTAIDCFEKRNQKGILFTIGDEPCLPNIPKSAIKGIMGEGQFENFESSALLNAAREKYDVFHVHIRETSSGSRRDRIDHWRQLIQDNLLIANRHEDVAEIISEAIVATINDKPDDEQVNDENSEEVIL